MSPHSSNPSPDRLEGDPAAAREPEDRALYGKRGQFAEERRIDGLNRDEMCRRYQRRILVVARRLAERLPPDAELGVDDLASFGAIGLLEAFDRYDPGRAILFSTFAEYRIRGAMMDALRQNDSFTRYRRQMSRRIGDAARELLGELGRPPLPEEIALRLGIDIDAYWQAADRVIPVARVSLDSTVGANGGEGRPLFEAIEGSDGQEPFRNILGQQVRGRLREALHGLPEKQRQCVILYYGRGLNLAEVAAVFDVTPSRICQILSLARRALRDSLATDLGDEGPGADVEGVEVPRAEGAAWDAVRQAV